MTTTTESPRERAFWNAMSPEMEARVKALIAERRALVAEHETLAAKYADAGMTLLAGVHADEARRLRRDLPQQEG